jgi:hypothetical protein
MQIESLAFKKWMFLHVKYDVQVAGRASEGSGFAETAEADSSSVFHPRRNFRIYRPLSKNAALSTALGARIGDDAARTLTSGTGARDAEETLLVTDLAASRTGPAIDWSLSGRGAVAVTVFAHFVAANVDLRLGSEDRLLEVQIDVLAEIGAALRTAALSTSAAEHFADVEEVAKDIAEILEGRRIEAACSTCGVSNSGMAETVVKRTLLTVSENGVGFTAFFKFFFRVRIVGISIRMKLQGELAVRALDLLIGSASSHAENFVVIAFYVASQNSSSPIFG